MAKVGFFFMENQLLTIYLIFPPQSPWLPNNIVDTPPKLIPPRRLFLNYLIKSESKNKATFTGWLEQETEDILSLRVIQSLLQQVLQVQVHLNLKPDLRYYYR